MSFFQVVAVVALEKALVVAMKEEVVLLTEEDMEEEVQGMMELEV